jgi:hypothetical protein
MNAAKTAVCLLLLVIVMVPGQGLGAIGYIGNKIAPRRAA